MRATQKVRMFFRYYSCLDVYFGVKQNPIWAGLEPAWVINVLICVSVRVCVSAPAHAASLSVCLCACVTKRRVMCVRRSTCVVFAAVSGDICCVVGWEQITAGCRSLRLRRWKPRSQPGPVGQVTQTQNHTCKRQQHTQNCMHKTHSKHMSLSLSHTQREERTRTKDESIDGTRRKLKNGRNNMRRK